MLMFFKALFQNIEVKHKRRDGKEFVITRKNIKFGEAHNNENTHTTIVIKTTCFFSRKNFERSG